MSASNSTADHAVAPKLQGSTVYIFLLLLAAQSLLLAWSAWSHSPTHAEVFHLPAGLSHLELSRHDLYRVNPPLVRKIAALPAFLAGYKGAYSSYSDDPFERAEYGVGIDTAYALDSSFTTCVAIGRLCCIPIMVAGSCASFFWSSALYKSTLAGFLSMIMWMTCPYALGHGSLLTPDAHAASLGILASYAFWKWIQEPRWSGCLLTGVVLGLAELTKFTLLVFYPIWLVLWLALRWRCLLLRQKRAWTEASMLMICLAISVFVINLGYEFEGTFRSLGQYRFRSHVLSGLDKEQNALAEKSGNRFRDTWLRHAPVPLPANYVYGFDTQKHDFELGSVSYLNGSWQHKGWWYFHPFALLIKLPLGSLGLFFILVIGMLSRNKARISWHSELHLLLPVLVILLLLVSNTGIGMHSRYSLPILPFLFVWCGKLVRVTKSDKRLAAPVLVLLVWSVCSSLFQFPHSLGYFNELVGPKNGFRFLAKSDSSWGQDLLFLKEWMKEHPEASPLHLAHCGPFDPQLAGIKFLVPPVGPIVSPHTNPASDEELGPQPGYFAIDVCFLLGTDFLSCPDDQGNWYEPSNAVDCDLSYFLNFEPVAWGGSSICIYHLKHGEVDEFRKFLGMARLPRLSQQAD